MKGDIESIGLAAATRQKTNESLEKLRLYLQYVNRCLVGSIDPKVLQSFSKNPQSDSASDGNSNVSKDDIKLKLHVIQLCLDFSPENLLSQGVFTFSSQQPEEHNDTMDLVNSPLLIQIKQDDQNLRPFCKFTQVTEQSGNQVYLLETEDKKLSYKVYEVMTLNEKWIDEFYTLPLQQEISLVRSKIKPAKEEEDESVNSLESNSNLSKFSNTIRISLLIYDLIVMIGALALLVTGVIFLSLLKDDFQGLYWGMIVMGILFFIVNLVGFLALLFKNKTATYWGAILKLLLICTCLAFLVVYKKTNPTVAIKVADALLATSILIQCVFLYLVKSAYLSMS